MAIISSNVNLTLAEWAKRRNPDGSAATIANILSQQNEILDDQVYVEANGTTHHRTTVATGLPTVYWRMFNQGIPASSATTAQVDEGIGMMEKRSEVDCALADLGGDAARVRLGESRLSLEAMYQEQTSTLIYGDSQLTPNKFMGLSPRYSDLSADNAQNILSCNGSGSDNTSIWLIGWGDETVHMIFPKGSNAGLEQRDLGEQTVYDVNGVSNTRMQAYVDWYCMKSGLVVKDWRYAVRICNIDVSDAKAFTNNQALTDYQYNILHQMTNAVYRIENLGMCRPAFYVNRTIHAALSRMAMEKFSSVLAFQSGISQFGTPRRFMSFMDIPIRRCDALLNTETAVA